MANNGIKITAPVSVSDLASVLGDTTDLGRSPSINKWAKYRSFKNYVDSAVHKLATDEVRAASDWGIDVTHVGDSYDSMLSRTEYSILLPAATDYCRLADFDGYNHLAKCGFGFTNSIIENTGTAVCQLVGDSGDNISPENLYEVLNLKGVMSGFTEFGLQLRVGQSLPLKTYKLGTFDDVENGFAFTWEIPEMLEAPVLTNHRGDGEIFLYAKDPSTGRTYALNEPIVITNNATSGDVLWANGWNPNMKIGSILTPPKSLNEIWRSNSTISLGIGDTLLFDGLLFTNSSATAYSYSGSKIPHVVIEYNGTKYFVQVYEKIATQRTSLAAFKSTTSIQYVSAASLRTFLPYNQEVEVKIYLDHRESLLSGQGKMTAPITIKLFISGADADYRDQFPEFPPIEDPDWSSGFDL